MEENMKKDYSNNPKGMKIEGFPDYIEELPGDKYKIIMRDGTYYVCEEVTFAEIKQILDRSKTGTGATKDSYLVEGLFKRAIVYPEMDDEKINSLKGSHFFKLQHAFNKIYDIESFL